MPWTPDEIVLDEPDAAYIRFRNGKDEIEVIAVALLESRVPVLRDPHVQGGGRSTLGHAELRRLADAVKGRLDVDELRVEGAIRTSGAGPGRRPRPLVF